MRTLLVSFLVSSLLFVSASPEAVIWQELKGTHFIVYFTKSEKAEGERAQAEKFAKEVLRKAEQCYKTTADELGYRRYSNFWTWDNRMKIYIYPDHKSYVELGGQPEWTGGAADYTNKRIISYRWKNDKQFLEALLPHELGHMMFRDFIGFESDVPLWLDEGVAQWQEQEKRKTAKESARQILKQGKLLHLKKLTRIGTAKLGWKMEKKSIDEFYAQAVSLIDFLITTYGKDSFTRFCRYLRDGKSMDEALRFSYPPPIRDMKGLEKKWVQYIRRSEK